MCTKGAVVPNLNVLVTIENTDPACFWLTSFLETVLMRVGYPVTVAPNTWKCKQLILKYLRETCDASGIGFKLHDFGARGASSMESAMLGGMAHLVNFHGTDSHRQWCHGGHPPGQWRPRHHGAQYRQSAVAQGYSSACIGGRTTATFDTTRIADVLVDQRFTAN